MDSYACSNCGMDYPEDHPWSPTDECIDCQADAKREITTVKITFSDGSIGEWEVATGDARIHRIFDLMGSPQRIINPDGD